MAITTHISGFPRVGAKRELKFCVEKYWKGDASEQDVLNTAAQIRKINR
ncbi:MAG: hypothetical protein IJR44_02095, partial [Neisseriaceae bacterium]|nr:hypothetical protein [Neisseriaceae bacterium]